MKVHIIEGLMLSFLSDHGPETVYNLSPLDEVAAQKLSILGMTIILMGSGKTDDRKRRYFKIHGPIPVPGMYLFETLCLPFNATADLETKDIRIATFGREYILWFFFNTSDRAQAVSKAKDIEEITKDHIKFLKTESQLMDKSIYLELLEKVQMIYSDINSSPILPSTNIQPYRSEYGQYGIYTINLNGNIVPIMDYTTIPSLDVLIVINIIERRISIIKMNPNVSQQHVYIVNQVTNKFNSDKFKSEFRIRNITDELESQMIIDKIAKIYGKHYNGTQM